MFRRNLSLLFFLLAVCSCAAAQPIDPALYSGMKWRLIGPFRGGRSVAATGVPGHPDLFYFGSVGGGVWKSQDAGTTWQPIFDSQPVGSIGAIAVAPSNPDVIYVGSGEADMRSQISYGDGMYKSIDGGKTWRNIGLRDTQQIGRIVVHPRNPDVLFVAALGHAYAANVERGVFRSRDGGSTWQKVLFKDNDTGAIDLAMDPRNPQTIYASLWQTRRPPWNVYPPSNGPGSGLYKSTDGGSTWQQIIGNGFPSEGLGRIGIAVSPADSNRVYCIVDAKDGGLYRSDDAGATWRRMDGEQRIWGRGWYFGQVAADPKDVNTLYVMNTSTYRSRDGGQTFDAIKGAPGGDDYHQLWINPDDPRRMVLASDQGVVVSVDGAQNWSSWYNQATAQIYRVATDNSFPYRVYGAQQDSGAVMVPSRTNASEISFRDWAPACAGGESGMMAPDPNDPNILFGGTVTRCNQPLNQPKNVSPTLALQGQFRNTWTLPLVFSPADRRTLYFSHQMLFKTSDAGQSWQQISPDLTRDDPGVPANLDPVTAKDAAVQGPRKGVIYSIAPSPLAASTIWVGTDDGLIYITRDGGKTWQNVTPPELTPWSKVATLEASHFDPNTAYAAVDRHRLDDLKPYIYRTRDGGKSWQKITNGLPDNVFVNAIREDTARKGLLFAATELAVYVSFDDGDRWQPLQLNLPAVSMRDFAIHDDDLIVATHGRSFWVLDNITPLRQISAQTATADATLFKPAVALRVRPGSEDGTPLPKGTAIAENPPSGAVLDYFLKAQQSTPITLEIYDSSNQLVRRYSSADQPRTIDPKSVDIPAVWLKTPQPPEATAGMHRFVWDLHWAPPTNEAPTRGFAFFGGGGGPWALPGMYTVKLTANGHTYTQPLEVKMDPRVKTPAADLQRQFSLAQQAAGLIRQASQARQQANTIHQQLQTLRARATDQSSASRAIESVDRKLMDVIGRPGRAAPGGFPEEPGDPTSFQAVTRSAQQMLQSVESADVAPTQGDIAALQQAQTNFAATMARWNEIKSKDLQQLNATLRQANMPSVSAEGNQ